MTLQPSDITKLDDHVTALDHALAAWETRDDTQAQPGVRRAANTAMDAIDALLADLHRMRSRLIGEIRASDDATAARVDAMLDQAKAQPE